MTYDEAYKITGNANSTTGMRNTGAYYWLASAIPYTYYEAWNVNYSGSINSDGFSGCRGVRPVVSLTSGVYIKAGTGTESDPYILGKD